MCIKFSKARGSLSWLQKLPGVVLGVVCSVLCMEAQESSETEGCSSEAVSILDCLKAPTRSALVRKLKSQRADKKHKSTKHTLKPKTVSPSAHVKEFAGEYLTVQHSKLFCDTRREELSLKKRVQ